MKSRLLELTPKLWLPVQCTGPGEFVKEIETPFAFTLTDVFVGLREEDEEEIELVDDDRFSLWIKREKGNFYIVRDVPLRLGDEIDLYFQEHIEVGTKLGLSVTKPSTWQAVVGASFIEAKSMEKRIDVY